MHVVQSAVDPAGEYPDAQRFQAEDTKPFPNLKKLLASAEKKYLQKLVSHTSGNIKKICWISGLSRSRVYERLKKYDISLHA